MKGFVNNIEELTKNNNDFRRVIYTAPHSQLVLMSLNPGEEIGMEVHNGSDQFIRLEEGEGKAIIDGGEYQIKEDWAIIIPAGANHNIINTGGKEMKLYTIYSPPHHRDGIVRHTKQEADTDDEEFDGKTTEGI